MKFKKILPVIICSALLAGASGALLASQSVSGAVRKANADTTDLGTFDFDNPNNDSTSNWMYAINWVENEAPAGWDSTAFAPVDANSGTFVNGVRVSEEIKKIGPYTYYIPVPEATVGTAATVKGTWSNGTYSFTVKDYTRQWNGASWVIGLEDYDIVSLADANMPDFEGAINTEDAAGYGYISDPAYLAKQKGIFALRNDTGSYAFEFNFEADGEMTEWVDVRIGASGVWNTGHFLQFKFNNSWGGKAHIYEYQGTPGDIWSPVELQESPEFNVDLDGQTTIQVGAIRAVGYENKYYVFFKCDGIVKYGEYWDLDPAPMTTKVGIYTATTNITIKNSRAISNRYQIMLDTNESTATVLQFNTGIDIIPPVKPWAGYFIPVEDGIKLNGSSITTDKWNYFKKSNTTVLYLDIGGDVGVTPTEGDILSIGGMFKLAHDIGDGVLRAYKLYLYDYQFQFDGTAWRTVDADYHAEDFSKDLLKETLAVCAASWDGNHDELESIWAMLKGDNYFKKLLSTEVVVLQEAEADSSIVVPDTAEGIDAMSSEDAIKAAMARYDWCTAKYSLNDFIGRSPVAGSSTLRLNNANTNTLIIIAICAVLISVSAIVVFFSIRKRKHQ